jgi:hypothetical protein
LAWDSVSERAWVLFLECDAQANGSTGQLEGKTPAGQTLTELKMDEGNSSEAI